MSRSPRIVAAVRRPRFVFPLWLLSLLALAACSRDSLTAPDAATGEPALAAPAGLRLVNSLADPGNGLCDAAQCTLREAIHDAGSTEIRFEAGLSGVITLARPGSGGGTLVIDKALTITGPRAGIVIRRLATDPGFRLLRIGSAGVVSLKNLTLRNGQSTAPGAGISNFGSLTLTRCTVTGNATAEHGGGIDNHGPLVVINTTIEANSAATGRGAGIDNHHNGMLTVLGSVVTRNSGVGVTSEFSHIVIRASTISYNSSNGIVAWRRTATLDSLKVVGNAGRGVSGHRADITLSNSTVARNGGGGVGNSGGRLTIENSSVVRNSSVGPGGGIRNSTDNIYGRGYASVLLTNSTVSYNSASSGGGIHNSDEIGNAYVWVVNSTIAFNSATDGAAGIDVTGGVESGNGVWLSNSIVARNSGPDLSKAAESYLAASFSLIGDGTGSGITNENGNLVGNVNPYPEPIDPLLGPLTKNGGPTVTHALLPGSPAIDTGTSENCPATDQRGVARPQGSACDMGSFEREQ